MNNFMLFTGFTKTFSLNYQSSCTMIKKILFSVMMFLCGCATSVPPLVNNISSALRLNGFYYELSGEEGSYISTYFLYKNGVCYYNGSKEYKNKKELDIILNNAATEIYSNTGSKAGSMYGFWGTYEIKQDSITMKWQLLAAGKRIVESRGLILNDSTFFMYSTREYKSGSFKENGSVEFNHFKKSFYKPDSINIFFK